MLPFNACGYSCLASAWTGKRQLCVPSCGKLIAIIMMRPCRQGLSRHHANHALAGLGMSTAAASSSLQLLGCSRASAPPQMFHRQDMCLCCTACHAHALAGAISRSCKECSRGLALLITAPGCPWAAEAGVFLSCRLHRHH